MGYIKIVPVINTAYHNGFNYYTIFNDENRFYQFYGWGLFYITTFDNIFDYNVVARDSHLDPMAFKKNINSNLLSNYTALNDNIIVITKWL